MAKDNSKLWLIGGAAILGIGALLFSGTSSSGEEEDTTLSGGGGVFGDSGVFDTGLAGGTLAGNTGGGYNVGGAVQGVQSPLQTAVVYEYDPTPLANALAAQQAAIDAMNAERARQEALTRSNTVSNTISGFKVAQDAYDVGALDYTSKDTVTVTDGKYSYNAIISFNPFKSSHTDADVVVTSPQGGKTTVSALKDYVGSGGTLNVGSSKPSGGFFTDYSSKADSDSSSGGFSGGGGGTSSGVSSSGSWSSGGSYVDVER